MLGYIALQAAVAATPTLAEPLRPMAYLVGHCWTGEFRPGVTDTHCFEPVYGGRFIRDRHEVTGGYAGESLYSVEGGRVSYVYWNSQGGVSRGAMTAPRPDVLDFGNETHRAANGTAMVFSTAWHRVDERTYEVRVTAGPSHSGNRVTRYVRADAAPVAVSDGTNPDGTRRMVHEGLVSAPPAAIYAALSNAAGWRRWAAPNAWDVPGDGDLMETSYAPGATLGDPANIQQRFLARVPDRLVIFRTVRCPPGFPEAEAYMRTTTIVELIPEGAGTRARLTTTGYPAGASGDRLIGFFREGNRTTLETLRRVLAAR